MKEKKTKGEILKDTGSTFLVRTIIEDAYQNNQRECKVNCVKPSPCVSGASPGHTWGK